MEPARRPGARGSPASAIPAELEERLREVGERRIAAMDEAGLDVQVISLTSPGLHNLPPEEARRLQVETNDRIAELVYAHPDRFQGFATLATPAPAAAAQELERAVTELGLNGALLFGRTGERNLDHPDNWPIFEAAASLRAPLYIHPQIPQPRVRAALYAGFDGAIDTAFATYGIGWHYESGVQFLRLALAGVFDRFPDLQVLLGHWGEVVLFYLDRADGMAMQAKLPQPFSEYVRRTPTSRPAASTASATCGGRSRSSAWSASCSRPTTPTGPAPKAASSASLRPPGSIGPTRSESPPATGTRSWPASDAEAPVRREHQLERIDEINPPGVTISSPGQRLDPARPAAGPATGDSRLSHSSAAAPAIS